MVWSEGNVSVKNPVKPPGIDPRAVRLVAQRLYSRMINYKLQLHGRMLLWPSLEALLPRYLPGRAE